MAAILKVPLRQILLVTPTWDAVITGSGELVSYGAEDMFLPIVVKNIFIFNLTSSKRVRLYTHTQTR